MRWERAGGGTHLFMVMPLQPVVRVQDMEDMMAVCMLSLTSGSQSNGNGLTLFCKCFADETTCFIAEQC